MGGVGCRARVFPLRCCLFAIAVLYLACATVWRPPSPPCATGPRTKLTDAILIYAHTPPAMGHVRESRLCGPSDAQGRVYEPVRTGSDDYISLGRQGCCARILLESGGVLFC